jgi:hypothetical protein
MRSARSDRAAVRLCAVVGWILTGKFQTLPEATIARYDRGHDPPSGITHVCSSAEELEAQESLLVALRDDDVRAMGRFSGTRAGPAYAVQCRRAWTLHSRLYTKITSEQWLAGAYDWAKDSLDLPDGQFIELQVPRWAVEAFWPPDPKPPPEVGVADNADTAYTTPYLELMQQAIQELGISAAKQLKKGTVMDWFRQNAGDVSLSENLIRHLATFVRLPDSQRGGNRRGSDCGSSK